MKNRIEIQKRSNISKEKLNRIKVESIKDRYCKLSYEITIEVLDSIINENKNENIIHLELEELQRNTVKLQKEGNIEKILRNNLKMRVYNWVLNDNNKVEIEWIPYKYR